MWCLFFCLAARAQEAQQKDNGPVLKLTSSSFDADADILGLSAANAAAAVVVPVLAVFPLLLRVLRSSELPIDADTGLGCKASRVGARTG